MNYKILSLFFLVLIGMSFVSAFDWATSLNVYWSMNETSNPILDSTYHHNATNVGATSVVGKLSNAYDFESTESDKMTFTVQCISNQPSTVNAWIKPESAVTGGILSGPNAGSQNFVFYTKSDGKLAWGKIGADEVTSTGTIGTGSWVMVTAVLSANNVSFFINGAFSNAVAYTTTVGGNCGGVIGAINADIPSEFQDGIIDELGYWARKLSFAEIAELYNSGNGLAYGTSAAGDTSVAQTITLKTPTSGTVFNVNNTYINASYYTNVTYATWKNATYYTWKDNAEYNVTVVNLFKTGVYNNNTNYNYSLRDLPIGSYKWNVFACFNFTTNPKYSCNWSDNGNFTFEVGALPLQYWANETTYETKSESYQLNLSMFPGTSLISAYLYWNGTPYSVSDITTVGTQKILRKTIDIPLNPYPYKNESRNYFWSFTFTNSVVSPQNTSSQTQYVVSQFLTQCNSTYRLPFLNFTLKDELTKLAKTGYMDAIFQYWTGTGSIKKNYSFSNQSNLHSNFTFCGQPNWTTFNVDMDLEYSANYTDDRTYFFSGAVISNATRNIDLLLLNSTLGTKFFFTLTNSLTPVEDAIITISKFVVSNGTYETISTRKSDTSGQFIEYLELDKQYQFSISKNGVFMGILYKTATCSSSPCEISLELSSAIANLWSGYYDTYAQNVAYNLTYNPVTHNVTFIFVDLSGLAQYFRLQVNKISYNQTGEIICNYTSYTTAGTLVCPIGNSTGNFRADAFISRSPEKLIATIMMIASAIRDAIGNDGLLFTLIAVVTVALIGAWSPVVGIILAAVTLFFAATMGFIAISYVSVTLIFILAIFLIVKMGKGGNP